MKKIKMHYKHYDYLSVSLSFIITGILFYIIVVAMGFEELNAEQAENAAGGMVIFGIALLFGVAYVVEWFLLLFIDNGRKG
jgi:Zn-dependent protease with chaperone function